MELIKMHGLGNDFIFLDHFLVSEEVDFTELAIKLCHRQFGLGADGLVVVLPSETSDARMRIFNSDGSEPEMCGNGIRCFARFIYDKGYVAGNAITVETLAGVLELKLHIEDNIVKGITVDMGEPILKPSLVPVLAQSEPVIGAELNVEGKSYKFTAVSMGNPHCVIYLDSYEGFNLEDVGPAIEKHQLFPKKTNVEFIKVESPKEITMRVWERGSGVTMACGTGACAATVASVLNGYTDRLVTVHLPGGDLSIEWKEDNHVYMTGPATYVFRAQLLNDKL